jgi:hypothetical protein
MFIKDNILYAGVSNENGAKLNVVNTGYSIQRITDGVILGSTYKMQNGEDERLFIEIVDDSTLSNIFVKDNIMIAGVKNENGFDVCIKQENLYTGKKFVRIHDGQDMGNIVYLGVDYSYNLKGRKDLPIYYIEIEEQQ